MGSWYLFKITDENSIYERGETNNIRIEIKDKLAAYALVDPSTVSISINDPCSSATVNNVSMTKISTGVYAYYYNIPDDSPYGEYEITFTVTTPTYTQKYKDRFIILPWNAIQDIRTMTGMANKKSISDHDIAKVILESYRDALDSVYRLHENEAPNCNPDTGAWFDGTNTTFATKHSPIADSNGDGVVTGWGQQSCGTDVDGWWKDEDGDCHQIRVTVNEAHCGNIDITQLDGSAIPSTCNWVRLNYRVEYPSFNNNIFKDAVINLAADTCVRRFWDLHRATLADLDSNKAEIITYPKRFHKHYLKLLKKIKEAPVGTDSYPGHWKEF